MPTSAAQITQERITMAAARAITGKGERALRTMALAGDVPGAVKIGGEWTFDERRLRAWIVDLEREQASRCAKPEKPRVIVSGKARSSGAARRSKDGNADGRYEQTMSRLLKRGSRPTGSGRSQPRITATPERPTRTP